MKRFWNDVSVVESDGGWRVALDGRPIRTQMGAAQVIPTRALADMLAAEWASQGEEIDAASFPLRDMADYAIDMVAGARDDTIDKLLRYAETDTLCYRADPDEPLWKRQQAVWEPLLTAFEAREGVRLERVSGIVHRAQPAETLACLRARLAALDPFTLAALEVMTSLAASLSVGLSALLPDADAEALWDAAELEEAWQVELWGSDALAEERRVKRRADFLRSARFAKSLDPS
ncbi:ATP12 chaperone protein [Tsuneonella dongtanensis]|uniref:ATP12 chaperone protein n=1 Tax=Tsuneonella dongtanensis TaxID=692370 RepID=A0A1B2ACP5_9SPHN|nr:ATP12 family protein [Tsuneonella dongtanensis]ANY19932.1 ATP12 chaperone protein [Tsuneonella dongtanensis]